MTYTDFTPHNETQLSAVRALLLGGDVYHTLDANRRQLFALIPELAPMVGFPQNNPYHSRTLWDHTIFAVSQIPADFVLRMTMLLHDIGKLETRTTAANGIDHFYGHEAKSVKLAAVILRRLAVDRQTAQEILTLIALHDVDLFAAPDTLRQLRRACTPQCLSQLICVKQADILAQNPQMLGQRLQQLSQLRTTLCGT
jgi:tRNA nucleotidyltransferase (CCA-adding enzyme)